MPLKMQIVDIRGKRDRLVLRHNSTKQYPLTKLPLCLPF